MVEQGQYDSNENLLADLEPNNLETRRIPSLNPIYRRINFRAHRSCTPVSRRPSEPPFRL